MRQLELLGHKLDLWHAKQANPWGCMHHALYAGTGDERFLEHIDDVNTAGAALLTWQLGYWEISWFVNLRRVKADTLVWEAILERWPTDYIVVQVSIDSLRHDDTTHAVAIAINLSGCTELQGVPFAVVSDSNEDDFVHFETLEAFLAGPYAGAYEIETLYRLPQPYVPEMVWEVDAPHLHNFDWSRYPPAQAPRPDAAPAGRDSP